MTEPTPPVDETEHVPEHAAPVPAPVSNKLYDILKFCAQVLFPAAGTLYFTLAGLWSLPNAEKVVGSITAVDLFLGVIVVYLAAKYNGSDAKFDGDVVVSTDAASGNKKISLALNSPPEEFLGKDQLTFKVKADS